MIGRGQAVSNALRRQKIGVPDRTLAMHQHGVVLSRVGPEKRDAVHLCQGNCPDRLVVPHAFSFRRPLQRLLTLAALTAFAHGCECNKREFECKLALRTTEKTLRPPQPRFLPGPPGRREKKRRFFRRLASARARRLGARCVLASFLFGVSAVAYLGRDAGARRRRIFSKRFFFGPLWPPRAFWLAKRWRFGA